MEFKGKKIKGFSFIEHETSFNPLINPEVWIKEMRPSTINN